MNHLKKLWQLLNNYLFARLLPRSSTAKFWYLPEPPNITNQNDLTRYKNSAVPFYLMNYSQKLKYNLTNAENIIVLPYADPIGQQINPEAAFQYALGLHDQFIATKDKKYLEKFFHYANYFLTLQTKDGDWQYQFDWFESKAPWSSALAQSRGASVMLRAFMHSKQTKYKDAALLALSKFNLLCSEDGYLNLFAKENCAYFEEYPKHPTGVINGFMSALFGVWELAYWLQDSALENMWQQGVASLIKMLPHYTVKGWSLYDQDQYKDQPNLNSPRYHLLMINYLRVLSNLDSAPELKNYLQQWQAANNFFSKLNAYYKKAIRKIMYR